MPITQPPKKNISRAYYSPNTKAYELGYRGGYGHKKIAYIKEAIALAVARARFNIKSLVMNIRTIADETRIESAIQTNYYVIPSSPGPGPVPGDETEIFDNVPEDYNEQDDNLGESQIPDPNYNN